jgi:hypothetical protein
MMPRKKSLSTMNETAEIHSLPDMMMQGGTVFYDIWRGIKDKIIKRTHAMNDGAEIPPTQRTIAKRFPPRQQ